MNKRKIVEKWIMENGAADFDLKKRDIILFDGGLFAIEKKKVKRRKIVGQKKLPNGWIEILFSKNKCVNDEEYYATLWFEELWETILYLKRMDKMLRSLGYDTHKSVNWKKSLGKKLKK